MALIIYIHRASSSANAIKLYIHQQDLAGKPGVLRRDKFAIQIGKLEEETVAVDAGLAGMRQIRAEQKAKQRAENEGSHPLFRDL